MDNLGSEVGQKMRSAVKAKLIELGTGGLAGYIDDELPDYVMIMIANKRSKQQMIGDLQLFLGSQTELFVTWLHEVLQKLQEVTLPATVVHKTKRKSDTNDVPVAGKKEKKDKRKEKESKKLKKSSSEQQSNKEASQIMTTTTLSTSTTTTSSSSASISDVFADHLLQKAKKTMQTENVIATKIKKCDPTLSSSSTAASSGNKITRDEFDIPTITEISESVEEISRKRDLEELSKIQKKIYQTKAKLKLTADIMDDSDDDNDYLNIRAEKEELDDVEKTTTTESVKKSTAKIRNPIVYDSITKDKQQYNENKSHHSNRNENDNKIRDLNEKNKKRVHITFSSNEQKRDEESKEIQYKKKPIHERLGFVAKPVMSSISASSSLLPNLPSSSSSLVSSSSSIYRRLENNESFLKGGGGSSGIHSLTSLSSRTSERHIENYGGSMYIDKNEKDRIKPQQQQQQQQQKEKHSDDNTVMRRRIGSRVIVAPPKKPAFKDFNDNAKDNDDDNDDDDDYDETNDKTVNSLIKIKPRPSISPSKQASKNLLLRAVAEAQKSTALIQPKKDLIHDRSPKRLNNKKPLAKLQTTKLYRRTTATRTNENLLKRITKNNIVIEIKSNKNVMNNENLGIGNDEDDDDNDDVDIDDDDEVDRNKFDDEYVPEPIHDRTDSDNDYVYIPQTINFDNADDNSESYDDEDQDYSHNKTQFVVTLDDKTKKKYISTSPSSTRVTGIHTVKHKNLFYSKSINGIEKEQKQIKDLRHNLNKTLSSKASYYDKNSSSSSSHHNEFSSPKRSLTSSSSSRLDRQYNSSNNDDSKNFKKYENHSTSTQTRSLKQKEQQQQPKEQQTQQKKIIIRYNSDDDEKNKETKRNNVRGKENLKSNNDRQKLVISNKNNNENNVEDDGSLTPPLPKSMSISLSVAKRKRSPIKFDINDDDEITKSSSKDTVKSLVIKEKDKNDESLKSSTTTKETLDNALSDDNTHKISIKKLEATKKYENIPESLSSIAVEAPGKIRVKERCKYFPSCTKGDACEYHHPTTPCKAFPNCKFVEKCLYLHPKCKYDLTCNRVSCNFSHSVPVVTTTNTAPPLSSHVVPVQNYKSISASSLPAICKYYPNCTNTLCNFYHPKLCRFGKNCMNKIECNFYHYDLPIKDKFKWVASLG